jgi:FkbM family methyltransferase
VISTGGGYMSTLKRIKRSVGRLTGVQVYGLHSRILQVIPNKKQKEAWWSYPSILRSIFSESQIDLVLDVGANRGQITSELRSFYKGPIISFEPVSSTFAVLKQAASHDNNWFLFNYALGNESKEQYINTYENSELDSLLKAEKNSVERFRADLERPVKELIKIRRLDDIVSEMPFDIHTRKIFMKMDTQGYDLEVFKGATSIYKNLVALQAELSHEPLYVDMPHWTESIDLFEKAGFSLAGLFPLYRVNFQYIESDCLMVKKPG